MNRPWMQFHTRDWLDNKELRRCSPTARAVLSDLMCLAHEGEPYGYLADRAGPLTIKYMASRCVVSSGQFLKAVAELKQYGRINQHEDGTLFIARMVEDERVRLARAAGGVKGGNPKLVNQDTEGKVNLQGYPHSRARVRADSDSDSQSDSQKENLVQFSPKKDPLPSMRFEEWWDLWSAVRGSNHRANAQQVYPREVTADMEADCFECTRSYLESMSDPRKGYNPENFLIDQRRDKFKARWPKARDSPAPRLTATQQAMQLAREEMERNAQSR